MPFGHPAIHAAQRDRGSSVQTQLLRPFALSWCSPRRETAPELASDDATACGSRLPRSASVADPPRARRESQMYHFDCGQRVGFASLSEWSERYYPRLVDNSAGNGWGFAGLLDQLFERGYVHVFELLDVET